jgi:hypothetical protein
MLRSTHVVYLLLLALLLAGCGSKKQNAQTTEPPTTNPAPSPTNTHPKTSPNPPATTNDETRQPSDPPRKAAITYEELKKLFVGKTKQEFHTRFGKPDSIQTDGADEYWYYKGLVLDPETKEPDENQVQVSIRNGIIQRFNR